MPKLLNKTQTKHLNQELTKDLARPELVLLLQDVADGFNVGSLFRTADAAGVDSVILCGQTPTPPHPDINTTARGLERSVAWEYVQNMEDAINVLHDQEFQVVGVEIAEGAVPYYEFTFTDKVCLVLGNEAQGIYKKHLSLCDGLVYIPMLGKGQSLNVNVSGAIVAYHVLTTANLHISNG